MATTPSDNEAALITEVDDSIKNVQTRALDISFNEILDMFVSDELIISPAYQRLFRWTEATQSRFIESLILEMPIPPLYMIEVEDNVYELIDGLQRISTWLHFRGKHPLRKEDDGSPSKLVLTDCDIIAGLNGLIYDDLPTALQIKLKRNFMRVEVIRKSSDARLRYHMFKRLNTGGAPLSDQEVRNCTVRLLDPTFNDFLSAKAANEDFRECTQHIRGDKQHEMYWEELVLRFFALKNNRSEYDHLVAEFLTHYMEAVSDSTTKVTFDYDAEGKIFDKTFAVMRSLGGGRAFRGPNTRFTVNVFEAWTLGLQPHLDRVDVSDATQLERIQQSLDELRSRDDFRAVAVGGGRNYPQPLTKRIELAAEAIASAL